MIKKYSPVSHTKGGQGITRATPERGKQNICWTKNQSKCEGFALTIRNSAIPLAMKRITKKITKKKLYSHNTSTPPKLEAIFIAWQKPKDQTNGQSGNQLYKLDENGTQSSTIK